MRLADKVVVVTGGASGIGAALMRRFAQEAPRALIVADKALDQAIDVAGPVGGHAFRLDVSSRHATDEMIDWIEKSFGPVDLFCANAGYGHVGDEQDDEDTWHQMWEVNLMSHVHAARRLVPGWVARGDGYFLVTASAAGLLTNLKAAQYSVTKHGAVAFAEWLAVTYGDAGVKVSCLCPMGVKTPFLDSATEFHELLDPVAISAEKVADTVVDGLAEEKFLITPHPEVEKFFQNKANDYDRWIRGMQKVQRTVFPS